MISAAPAETGGILAGFRDGETVRVIDASLAGPRSESSPTYFRRDGQHDQVFLKRVAQDHTKADYVGEWHSHPCGSTSPSSTDIDSLQQIAIDPDYLTGEPVMVIVGPGGGSGYEFTGTVHAVDGSFRPVQIIDG